LTQDIWFRSEEHTSELQSRSESVCRLLLEKKKRVGKKKEKPNSETDDAAIASEEAYHGTIRRKTDECEIRSNMLKLKE